MENYFNAAQPIFLQEGRDKQFNTLEECSITNTGHSNEALTWNEEIVTRIMDEGLNMIYTVEHEAI